jgi:spoIIIJ-associated protein
MESPGPESPGPESPGPESPGPERGGGERGGYRDRGRRPDRGDRGDGGRGGSVRDREGGLSESEQAEVRAGRASLSIEREEIQAAEASPEALAAGREILEQLLGHMGLEVEVTVESGDTSKLDVHGDDDNKEALGALIGRKGERLSALQHLVNLMLSRKLGSWTRVLVDVEDYRGRRERQLREIATRAAEKVKESGKMLQLEPMPALERRWIHLALRGDADVATQSIGEEPHRRVVILRRPT